MMFFTIVGMAVCAGLAFLVLGVVYWMFVHPAFQAISLTNWYIACCSVDGTEKDFPFWTLWAIFCDYYTVGGRVGERTWNSIGEWHGIGRWRIFPSEDDQAP